MKQLVQADDGGLTFAYTNPDDRELRIEALSMALHAYGDNGGVKVVMEAAKTFYDFMVGVEA